eukprot:710925_1
MTSKAFILLFLIILSTTAFTATIEQIQNHENILSEAPPPSLSKSAAFINTHNSQLNTDNYPPPTINMVNNDNDIQITNDATTTDTCTTQCPDTNRLFLVEPHKPRLNTLS